MTERCPDCGKFYDGYDCVCGYDDSEMYSDECSECGNPLESEETVCSFCGFDDDEQCFKVKLDAIGDIVLPKKYKKLRQVLILLPNRLIILHFKTQIYNIIRKNQDVKKGYVEINGKLFKIEPNKRR